jgi:tetratricopeptide (TPR) repeat protein
LFFSALSALEQRDWQTSERLFRKFIQADPSHKWTGRAYEKLGDAYIGTAEYKKAIDAYSEAAGRYSNPADAAGAYYKLGTACQSAGIAQKALEAFSKAISVGEKNGITDKVPESYYKLADYHYSMKAYEKALEYYTIASGRYKSFHDTPWGLFQIGNIYKNMKNYEKAVRAYDELMNEYRDEYWAGQAKWKKDDALWENEYKTVLQGN